MSVAAQGQNWSIGASLLCRYKHGARAHPSLRHCAKNLTRRVDLLHIAASVCHLRTRYTVKQAGLTVVHLQLTPRHTTLTEHRTNKSIMEKLKLVAKLAK